jgi:hypothetical protein
MKTFTVLLLAMAGALALGAQDTGNSPFIGSWKLDAAKSKYNPGPAMKSETVTIGNDGKVTVEGVSANGDNEHWSYTYTDGQEATITGMENSSVIEKRNGNTVEHTWKLNSSNYTGKGVLSKNGRVMTYTLDGTNQQGQHEHDVLIYEKQ